MHYPPLRKLATIDEYRQHFISMYCKSPILTFDNIPVYFNINRFDHVFYESSKRNGNKDTFSKIRVERIDWIKSTLQDPEAELYVGWNKKKKRSDHSHRVAVVQGNYVVIIRFDKYYSKAFFVTAFVADTPRTMQMIKHGKKWK